MKNVLSQALAISMLLGITNACADADTYRFDPVHTQIHFCTHHLGFSQPCGRLHVQSGSFSFDIHDWSTARVDVMIDIDSLNLGDTEWEAHVKSSEFLNAKRYPTARFVSQTVEKTNAKNVAQTGVVHGQLSMHGKTQKIDLPFTFNKVGVHPYTFKRVAGFSALLKIKRTDFGMDRYLAVVSDEVELRIEAEGWRDHPVSESAASEITPASETPSPTPAKLEEHHDAASQH